MEENKSRVYHSLKNARVSLFFTLIAIFIGFFSRKIFLDRLGVEFIGLSGTLQSLLGFLNIAELGIGTAVSYSLYKPLADGDREKLNDIISVMGYLYSRVGLFVLGAGVVLSFFIPLIFPKTGLPLQLIYFGFYSYLTSSLIGYFLNYRMTLLSADQRNYVVTKNLQMSSITQQVLQIVAAKYCANLYLFFTITLVFSVIYCIILNRKINAYYQWLNSTIANGKSKLKDFPDIKKKIRQIFVHQIGGVCKSQSANVMVYALVSLKDVAMLGNYVTITSKILALSECVMGGTWASVGNVVASCDKTKIYKVYNELWALRCIIAGSIVFVLFHILEPFVTLWLGKQYIMPDSVLMLLLAEVYLSLTRGANDQFANAYGLFFDTWVPWCELSIVIGAGCLLGWKYGVAGVMLGSVLSNIFLCVFWRPFMLFRYGFGLSVKLYFMLLLRSLNCVCGVFVCGNFVLEFLRFSLDSWRSFFVYGMIVGVVGVVFAAILVLLIMPGGKMLKKRVFTIITAGRRFI